jgi:predicted RNA-binding Zn-ribbon protein involved in translation (DUF1610 family)
MRMKKLKNIYVCPNCEYTGEGKVPGSTFITLVLLLFWVVPGVIYYFWRVSKKERICPKCGARPMMPYDTKRGRELSPLSEEEALKKIFWKQLPYYLLAAATVAVGIYLLAVVSITT